MHTHIYRNNVYIKKKLKKKSEIHIPSKSIRELILVKLEPEFQTVKLIIGNISCMMWDWKINALLSYLKILINAVILLTIYKPKDIYSS